MATIGPGKGWMPGCAPEARVEEFESRSASCGKARGCRAPRGTLLFQGCELIDCRQWIGGVADRYYLFKMHAMHLLLGTRSLLGHGLRGLLG